MVKGACVFDIDNTLTCDQKCTNKQINMMKKSIETCRENDFEVVINTARPPQPNMLHGIDTRIKTLLKGTQVYSRKTSCTNSVPAEKLNNMKKIAKALKVPLYKTVLVDDLLQTCRHVNNNGSTAIHVHKENGIDENEFTKIQKFVTTNKHPK